MSSICKAIILDLQKDLSDDEEYLLKEALSLLGQFEGLPNLDALEGLRLGLGVRKMKER